jgi:hypothetical protein
MWLGHTRVSSFKRSLDLPEDALRTAGWQMVHTE